MALQEQSPRSQTRAFFGCSILLSVLRGKDQGSLETRRCGDLALQARVDDAVMVLAGDDEIVLVSLLIFCSLLPFFGLFSSLLLFLFLFPFLNFSLLIFSLLLSS